MHESLANGVTRLESLKIAAAIVGKLLKTWIYQANMNLFNWIYTAEIQDPDTDNRWAKNILL